jgi:Cu/Ag efflux protein CusF
MKEDDLRKRFHSVGSRAKNVMIAILLITTVGILCAACGGNNQPQPEVKRYALKGKVISIDKTTHEVTVDHEAIPGFMGAMAMPYPVTDAKTLEQIALGDEITADLVVTDGRPALEKVVITKKAGAPAGTPSAK